MNMGEQRKPEGNARSAGAAPVPAFAFPSAWIPQGGGSFIVKPGKPKSDLTPKEFAQQIGVSVKTVYEWRYNGTISPKFVRFVGRRKFVISAAAIPVLTENFRRLRIGK